MFEIVGMVVVGLFAVVGAIVVVCATIEGLLG